MQPYEMRERWWRVLKWHAKLLYPAINTQTVRVLVTGKRHVWIERPVDPFEIAQPRGDGMEYMQPVRDRVELRSGLLRGRHRVVFLSGIGYHEPTETLLVHESVIPPRLRYPSKQYPVEMYQWIVGEYPCCLCHEIRIVISGSDGHLYCGACVDRLYTDGSAVTGGRHYSGEPHKCAGVDTIPEYIQERQRSDLEKKAEHDSLYELVRAMRTLEDAA